MSILKVWQLTLILVKNDPGGEVIQRKRLFYILLMRKHDFWPFQWLLNGQKWGGFKKASLYVHYKGLTTDSYFGKTGPPWRLFYTLLMRKHDFWPFHWFSNGQKWGVKKAFLYVYFEGLTTDSYFGKTRLPGERSYRKKGFFTLFWWENMISDLSIDFQTVKNGGFKKASLYVYFEGLTTDSYFGKTRPHGERLYRKRGFFTLFWWENMISDLSIDFQMVTNKGGLKKLHLYVHYEGLTTDSYFDKARLPGERSYRENGLFYTLLMRKHDFWPFHWFSNGQKLGVKKASLYVYFEGLTTNSYSGKARLLWRRGHIEKRLFYTLLMRKHDFWPFHWFSNGQK